MSRALFVLFFIGAAGCAAPAGTATSEADTSSESGESSTDGGPEPLCAEDPAGLVRPDGWGALSHCKGAEPDYARLFPDDRVHRLDITISADDHAAMQADLDELLGGGMGGPPPMTEENPIYVPVTVELDGLTWWKVGMRYKGNSSLHSAYQMGVRKYAFRLGFDKYEDENPELVDQRFWGFREMTFSNGFVDPSLIRDKMAGELFRGAGVPVARSAFARVYVDFGAGPTYFGLYTMIEDPSNRMLDSQFSDDAGNLYKPDGPGARLQTLVESDMVKKTNEAAADYSDVEEFIDVLNGGSGGAWRDQVESVFDVDTFLTYLALNQSMVNWDSYGWMTHNYYLYADPSDGVIHWIPWDLNEALMIRSGIPGSNTPSDSVLLDEVGSEWPLIRRVLDDPTYAQRYRDKLAAGLEGPFALEHCSDLANGYHDLIAPYAVGPDGEKAPYTFLSGEAAFTNSLTTDSNGILVHVQKRHDAIIAALQ